MKGVLRKAAFAVPFACLIALAAHAVRFGDEHAFGGDANEAIVATAICGSIAIALTILHAFLTAGNTTPTGTLAAVRARQLLPGAVPLFALAAGIYYGIESLEGNGIEAGRPTVLLAALAALLAFALRAFVAVFANVVAEIVRGWIALLGRREHLIWHRSLQEQPVHAQVIYATRRLGRAPPNGRRLP